MPDLPEGPFDPDPTQDPQEPTQGPRAELATVGSVKLQVPETFAQPDQNPVRIYLRRLGSEKSRRTQYTLLRLCIAIFTKRSLKDTWGAPEQFPWHTLRFQHVAGLQSGLREYVSERTGKPLDPDTVNRAITAVRGVLLQCKRLQLMKGDDYANAIDVDPVKGTRIPKGRMLEMGEVNQLREAGPTVAHAGPEAPIGVRDATIIALMAYTGVRLSEVAGLTMEKYLIPQKELHVLGKGNKERIVPVSAALQKTLEKWLQVRGTSPGPLFCRSHKWGMLLIGKPLTDKALYMIVKKLATEANLATMSPHDLRRTFISQLLDRGGDIKIVADLVGHNDINTTAHYDRRGEEERRAAVEKLDDG